MLRIRTALYCASPCVSVCAPSICFALRFSSRTKTNAISEMPEFISCMSALVISSRRVHVQHPDSKTSSRHRLLSLPSPCARARVCARVSSPHSTAASVKVKNPSEGTGRQLSETQHRPAEAFWKDAYTLTLHVFTPKKNLFMFVVVCIIYKTIDCPGINLDRLLQNPNIYSRTT